MPVAAGSRARSLALLIVLLAALLACPWPLTAPGRAAASPPGDDLERVRENRQELGTELGALTDELETLAVRVGDAREDRRRLAEDVRAAEAEAADAEEALRTRALATYVAGPGDPVHLLLSSSDPGVALARSRVLGGLGTRERGMIERAVAARAALGQRRAALDETIAALQADEGRVAELQARVAAAFDRAVAVETDLVNLRSRQRRVSRGSQQGVYSCPIAAPFHFRDTWGAPRSGGRRHKGVDIFGRTGAEVYAITSGRVARHSHSRLGGIGLYLAGDDGNQYYYAHLQEILPGYGPGRRVEAGEVVARNGSTGNADAYAPHIHLEIRPGGGAQVNPYPFMAAACY